MAHSDAIGSPRVTRTRIAAKAIVDFNRQRTKTEKAREEKLRLENQITRSEYLKRSEIARGLATIVDAVVSRVMAADIDRSVKEDILKNIVSLPLILEEVAHAQSRLAIAKSKKAKAAAGETPGETAEE
jgi:hypothetical protein